MTRTILAAAALLALAQGRALAQQDTAPASPYDATVQKSTQERVTYPDGTEVDKRTRVESGNGALSGSSSTTIVPPAPPAPLPPPAHTTTTYQSRTVTQPSTVTTTTTTDGNN